MFENILHADSPTLKFNVTSPPLALPFSLLLEWPVGNALGYSLTPTGNVEQILFS